MKKFFAIMLVLAIAVCSLGVLSSCGGKAFDDSKNIAVVTRGGESGTKSAFMELLGLKGKTDVSGSIQPSSTAAVLQEIKSNPLAIGYDSLGYVTDEVKMLKIDGVEATVENIKNGTYKLYRPLNVVYKQSTAEEAVNAAFLAYLGSSEAQAIITENGYVFTHEGTKSYTVTPGLSGEIDISGSTSLYPLMEILADEFEKIQPNVSITVAGGGSGTGYNNAENGVSDFGMISEKFKSEKAPSCTYYEVASDGIAVIVNKANPTDNISLEDLKNIYDVDAGDNAVKVWADIKK